MPSTLILTISPVLNQPIRSEDSPRDGSGRMLVLSLAILASALEIIVMYAWLGRVAGASLNRVMEATAWPLSFGRTRVCLDCRGRINLPNGAACKVLRGEPVQAQSFLDSLEATALQLGQEAPDEEEGQRIQARIDPHRAARA